MDRRDWRGVFPAITTPFRADQSVDHDALAKHVSWMIDSGSKAIVPLGSLGEAATLKPNEKVEILRSPDVFRQPIEEILPAICGA